MKDLSNLFYIEYGETKTKLAFLKAKCKGAEIKKLTVRDELLEMQTRDGRNGRGILSTMR